MVARRRRREESYEDYRDNLKEEVILEREKISGKWAYICYQQGMRPYVNDKKNKGK